MGLRCTIPVAYYARGHVEHFPKGKCKLLAATSDVVKQRVKVRHKDGPPETDAKVDTWYRTVLRRWGLRI